MYFSTLKFYILSDSRPQAETIADSLRGAEPVEDSEYRFEPTVFGEPFGTEPDCAVIIDGNAEYLRKYNKTADERVVFISSACAAAELDSETLSKADDLWIMPEKQLHDRRLLNVYFSNLVKIMKDRSDARRLQICFDTAIDSIPDLVWFKDTKGAHLMVNDGFCKAVEKTKQQIYKKGHYYIWDIPKEEYEQGEYVCLESEEIVMNARKTKQFDEKVKTKRGMRQFTTYKSPLIDVDGAIFGTCGIAHDVTDLQNISNEMRIMIDSIPFGVAIVDSDGIIVSTNRFLENYFPGIEHKAGQRFEEWNSSLPKKEICSTQEENEYSISLGGQERILRFREEPIADIFGEYIGSIEFIRDITIQHNFEQQNLKSANTDFLTGLNNRRSLFNYLTELGNDIKLSLIMIDLDRFKAVNDSYGHAAGDEALEITSRVLEECFPDGFIARLGGDEFLVALVGEHDSAQVENRTQHMLDTLLDRFSPKEEFHALSASAGVAHALLEKCDVQSIEKLIKRSDDALYNAKQSGKARYCVN